MSSVERGLGDRLVHLIDAMCAINPQLAKLLDRRLGVPRSSCSRCHARRRRLNALGAWLSVVITLRRDEPR